MMLCSYAPSHWQDQEGILGHPAADLSATANNRWFHRKMAIPAAAIGKTAARWVIAGENDADNIAYGAKYRQVLVTDGNGAVHHTAFVSGIEENEPVTSNGAAASLRLVEE